MWKIKNDIWWAWRHRSIPQITNNNFSAQISPFSLLLASAQRNYSNLPSNSLRKLAAFSLYWSEFLLRIHYDLFLALRSIVLLFNLFTQFPLSLILRIGRLIRGWGYHSLYQSCLVLLWEERNSLSRLDVKFLGSFFCCVRTKLELFSFFPFIYNPWFRGFWGS